MKTLVSLCAAALIVALAGPGVAAQRDYPDTLRWRTVEKFGREAVQKYAHLHRKWTKRNGREVVGRQIVKYGMPKHGGARVATQEEWKATLATFARWEHPPAPSSATQAVGGNVSYGGGVPAELEAIAQCESGGDYGAVNPSSGATGKYQILPSTAQAYGCDLATPAGQDACAVEIYAGGAGRSQWVC